MPRRSMLPREHGAYFQLALPLIAAGLSRAPSIAGAAIMAASCFAFLAHEPLVIVMGARGARLRSTEGGRARAWFALLAGGALVLGALGFALAPRTVIAVATLAGIDEKDLPGPGVDAYELFRKIDAGEIRGLISICFNPKVSLPDNQFVTRALDKLEFFAAIDFFLSDTARHADIVLPGSLQEEDEAYAAEREPQQ